MKRIVSSVLLGVMLVALIAPFSVAEAAKRSGGYSISSRYCDYVEHGPGQVTIAFWPASSKVKGYYVLLRDEKGKYIWEGYHRGWNDSETYQLGRDHKKYRIYVRTNAGNGSVTFR